MIDSSGIRAPQYRDPKRAVIAGITVWLLIFSFIASAAAGQRLRGAWVSGWGKGIATREEIDRTIAAAKQARFNILFFDCRKAADAYYKSSIEPMADGVEPGLDPLAYTITKAHAAGIRLYAWVSVNRVWKGETEPPEPRHLANVHRDWLSRSYSGEPISEDGIFVDPGVPEATAYTTRVIADLTSRYDIDGLQLDFIRYAHAQWGYAPAALKRYRDETGARGRPLPSDPRWREWKVRQVTRQVSDIRAAVHRTKPKLPITAATIAWGDCPSDFRRTFAYEHLGQDWKGWLTQGLIDANCPMDYRCESKPHEANEFRRWLDAFREWSGGKPVYVGVATYLNDASGVLAQMSAIESRGFEGALVFSFNESGRLCSAEKRKQIAEGLAKRKLPEGR